MKTAAMGWPPGTLAKAGAVTPEDGMEIVVFVSCSAVGLFAADRLRGELDLDARTVRLCSVPGPGEADSGDCGGPAVRSVP